MPEIRMNEQSCPQTPVLMLLKDLFLARGPKLGEVTKVVPLPEAEQAYKKQSAHRHKISGRVRSAIQPGAANDRVNVGLFSLRA